MKAIQEWLGHSNFSTTANLYAHLEYESKLEAARAISSKLTNVFSANSEQPKNPAPQKQKPKHPKEVKRKKANLIEKESLEQPVQ